MIAKLTVFNFAIVLGNSAIELVSIAKSDIKHA